MSEMIFEEIEFFFVSFLVGIVLIAVYDLVRIVRRTFPHGALLMAVEDMVFWITGGILTFYMIYEKNNGIIRGTAFLTIGIGMMMYHYTISDWIVRMGYRIFGRPIKKICLFFHKGLKKIQKPVKLLVKLGVSKKEGTHDESSKEPSKRSSKSN